MPAWMRHMAGRYMAANLGYGLVRRLASNPTGSHIMNTGSGFFAALCVKEEFGCVKWEQKSEDA
jgi:hypothetical protein